MKVKKIIAVCLALVIFSGAAAGCSESERPGSRVILTAGDGTEYTEGIYAYYVNYYAYQTYATVYAYYNTGTAYQSQYDSVDDFYQAYISQTYSVSDTETDYYYNYLKALAMESFLQYIIVERKFDEYGLKLTDAQQAEIDAQYKSSVDSVGTQNVSTICSKLGITSEDLKSCMVANSYKRTLLTNAIVGEGGESEITDESMHKRYEDNYKRFKYCVFSKVDEDGNALSVSETAELNAKINEAFELAESGGSFEDIIRQYSEAYLQVSEDDSEDEAEEKETTNEQMLNIGLIIDQNGIYDNTVYSLYGSVVDPEITERVFEMQNGEVDMIELDTAVWIIKNYDINENEECYETRAADIFSDMSSSVMTQKFSLWARDLDYTVNEEVTGSYDIRTLDIVFMAAGTGQTEPATATE